MNQVMGAQFFLSLYTKSLFWLNDIGRNCELSTSIFVPIYQSKYERIFINTIFYKYLLLFLLLLFSSSIFETMIRERPRKSEQVFMGPK